MLEGWRWYGPDDPVSLDDVRQAGASQIVSSLHQVPIGEAWTRKAVEERKNFIENGQPGRSQLTWSVVESIPIPDDVKRLGGKATKSIEAWIASLEAVAASGIKIICYNFMPVVDWCRTDLEWELPNGARAMRFDQDRLAAFELHILKRPAAAQEYSPEQQARAKKLFEQMSQADIDYLVMVIASALPGSTTEPMTIPQFRDRLDTYRDITPKILRQHLAEFLARVTPVAEQLDVSLTLHPDDPPRPLFGLPRIASSADDYQALFDAVPSKANGICFCTGSLGVRAENNLPDMAERFGPRIAFAHLRATKREADVLSFYESDHLDGDVDMIAVLKALLKENARRAPNKRIVFRPDHGHRMLDDLAAAKRINPGYTAIGRLRGLAELRGAIRAIEHR
ncbi:mannonate dehydratase [Bradyrhizobium yuanmingense]|uniref:Mannonate dehydratase n=2 Tax=Bradyrhizobium yuanmingense TaxID=108015 RepID=A0A0R3D0W8_9BRAD|nr:mannonate dehydratase [Bradyrhizobium yuanmingense]